MPEGGGEVSRNVNVVVVVTERSADNIDRDVVYEEGVAYRVQADNSVFVSDKDGMQFAFYPPGTYAKIVVVPKDREAER